MSQSTPASNEGHDGGQRIDLNPERAAFDGSQTLSGLGHTHFIGIGGAGMSVLAEMLVEQGVEVSGSDRAANDRTARLESLGVKVFVGQQAANVAGARTVVYSTAIKPGNPEIVAAAAQGSHIVHRSDILALLMAGKRSVSVAGAHGKTTTSSLLSHILVNAGTGRLADPSYAIGGSIQNPDGEALDGGHAGKGAVLVAEADESDGSFAKYHPDIALIVNAEADHLDHYGDAGRYRRAFVGYAGHAKGHVVMSLDDDGSRAIMRMLPPEVRRRTICYTTEASGSVASIAGIDGRGGDSGLDGTLLVRILSEKESAGDGAERFVIELPAGFASSAESRKVPVGLRVPGMHNARNATAAIICAALLGMDPDLAARAASTFLGASRRFEINGQAHGVTVVDDYAHHPTEIGALLAAARRRYPSASIRVLFQPHLFSRTKFFTPQFAQALAAADQVLVAPIYPARERQEDFPDVVAANIVDAAQGLAHDPATGWMATCESLREGAESLADNAREGDVIITVGAGDVTTMDAVILQRLAARDETERL
ncbi:UDP-N-acetylmuramate--L-alanine ligase [Bifidobacterium sp. ESL0763]|uniref:UDP-N-acetylmuramate--L-alanine ligase n=1 Tax=Bifidobacterium sp. ESL0763 TaxID=2983227 RepID=UPI0023F70EF7|nr:UDP-N-acetylmuramate--L-alanine ligase [Bifidobacterium sp. ESL0763]MDF7664147.1 UDP-N-acetylmuramate--L-alanine ligase [Bifidobacterium sp. ESL0763]